MLYLKFLYILLLLILLLLLANKGYLRFIPVNPWDVYEIRNLKDATIIFFCELYKFKDLFFEKKKYSLTWSREQLTKVGPDIIEELNPLPAKPVL
jgi:hypothetical protein